jgi:hypothetical protein
MHSRQLQPDILRQPALLRRQKMPVLKVRCDRRTRPLWFTLKSWALLETDGHDPPPGNR